MEGGLDGVALSYVILLPFEPILAAGITWCIPGSLSDCVYVSVSSQVRIMYHLLKDIKEFLQFVSLCIISILTKLLSLAVTAAFVFQVQVLFPQFSPS